MGRHREEGRGPNFFLTIIAATMDGHMPGTSSPLHHLIFRATHRGSDYYHLLLSNARSEALRGEALAQGHPGKFQKHTLSPGLSEARAPALRVIYHFQRTFKFVIPSDLPVPRVSLCLTSLLAQMSHPTRNSVRFACPAPPPPLLAQFSGHLQSLAHL